MASAATPPPRLSQRMTKLPDAAGFIERFSVLHGKLYHPEANPEGVISLAIAENCLIEDEMLDICRAAIQRSLSPFDLSLSDDLFASKRLNNALAGLFNDYFSPRQPVLPSQLICGNGVSALMDQIMFALADEGDVALIAAPYYTGFDRDLTGRCGIRLEPVYSGNLFSPSAIQDFREAHYRLTRAGKNVRAIILCSPHNPLGRVYPRDMLLEYARFCQEADLHLISDEIYALSVYDRSDDLPAFTSLLSLDVSAELGIPFDNDRLHVVYGMSKDFGANGLRLGCLVSQSNPALLQSLANNAKLVKISSLADVVWSYILTDANRLRSFLTLSEERLAAAHHTAASWFIQRGIRVFESNAGNFIWVDLGKHTGVTDREGEKALVKRLLDGGVYVAAGSMYHAAQPGWIRITFSVRPNLLELGLARIGQILSL